MRLSLAKIVAKALQMETTPPGGFNTSQTQKKMALLHHSYVRISTT